MTSKTGFASAADVSDDYAQLSFMVHQITGGMATAGPVEVIAVRSAGELAPVGYLDMKPLVHQTDGAGQAVPHGPLYNVPYFRLQGGTNAVIMDPVVGDIGLAVYASSDASRVKNTRKAGLPASRRRFDMADGFYLGGFLNKAPENYIRFTSSGDIEIKPATTVTVLGNFVANKITTAAGVDLGTHTHPAGSPNTGPPNP